MNTIWLLPFYPSPRRDAVVAKATTAEQRARASLLLRAFEYYEASVLSYPRRKDNGAGMVAWAEAVEGEGTDAKKSISAMAAKRRTLVNEFQHDPILQHPLSLERYKTLQW